MEGKQTQTNRIQSFFRMLLGIFVIAAGILNLAPKSRRGFLPLVPKWVPMDAGVVVMLAGVVEIVIGLGLLLLYPFRVLMGRLTALWFVAVFPGNVAQFLNRDNAFILNTDCRRFIRLPFQPVLIAWALWSTKPRGK